MDIKDTNFVTIQGWMRTKLNLKGNELLAYAVIYGFSQLAGTKFTGSRKYLAEWCGCSIATIDRTLISLVDKGLISKTSHITKYGNRAVEYEATYPSSIDEHSDTEPRTADADDPHTPTSEPEPLLNDPQTPAQPKKPDPTEEVVNHLNQRAGTRYKATTTSTRNLVKARLREGFTIEDMKLVIDKKCSEWLNNRDMAQYLRPETLFGNKFESYLNAKTQQWQQQSQQQRQPVQDNAAAYLEANAKYLTNDKGWF